MKIKNLLATATVAGAMLLVGCGPAKQGESGIKIKVWVSEVKDVDTLFKQQIKAFEKENNVKFALTIQGVGEGDAATQMLNDIDSGADIFCFAQDQLARLVQGGAIAQLGQAAATFVKENNDAGSVAAVTFGTGDQEKLYAYPLTSDNGIFMYYDKSVVSEEQAQTLEGIISACEAANKKISWKLGDIWHSAGFFFGAGCTSEWITDEQGEFVSVSDDFNSDNGFLAAKAMKKLLDSPAYAGSYNGAADFDAATPSAVVISGTWDKTTAVGILGDNFAAAKLPTFTVNGTTKQIGSFSGFKLMGVKPQTDPERAALLHRLAQYLTGAECEEARFNQFGWGPSNKAVQAKDKIQNDPTLKAFFAQSPYSIPQGNIHGDWWAIGNAIATNLQKATDDAGIRSALQIYEDAIQALFNVTEVTYGVCGIYTYDGVAHNWGNNEGEVDARLMPTDDSSVFKTEKPLTFAAGDQFKIRQNNGWNKNWGSDGSLNGPNYQVEAAGDYFVQFDLVTHLATLIPANEA